MMHFYQVTTQDMNNLITSIVVLNLVCLFFSSALSGLFDSFVNFASSKFNKKSEYQEDIQEEIRFLQDRLELLNEYIQKGQPDQRGTLAALDGLDGQKEN
jgi:hypothetical protein